MGLLRLYLALCVVSAHSGPMFPWAAQDGHQAVQIFYLISGFYMQMVYGVKYHQPREFYASRFIRIFLPYWIILGLTVVLGLFSHAVDWTWLWNALDPYFQEPLKKNGMAGFLLASISNATLFFQDWILFLVHDAGQSLQFTSDFRESKNSLHHYLLIPQAWTVSVELTFYLLVPWLSRMRSRTLIGIALAALALRISAYEILDLKRDPWEYRFFPFELTLFVSGMLAERFYRLFLKDKNPVNLNAFAPYILSCALLLSLMAATGYGVKAMIALMGYHYAILTSYVFWVSAIPVLFMIFGRCKYDRFVGELSYPVYLSHLIVVSFTGAVVGKLGLPNTVMGPISGVLSVLFAIFLYVYVFKPIDDKRYAMAGKFAKPTV